MTRSRATVRVAGWLLAGAVALSLIGGAAAFALAAERRESVLVLNLGTSPPSAPAIAAVSESAPDVATVDPSPPEPHDPADAAPDMPDATPHPVLASATPMALPQIETPVNADLSLPPAKAAPEPNPEPTTRPKARPEAKSDKPPEPETTPGPETKTERKRKEPRPEEPARAEKPASSSSAPSAATKAKGGGMSPAAYAKAVMKKVRATKRKSGAGKGAVVVGFVIAPDGGLASVQVLQSSGNAALDAVAVDHIRRSAPFPPPVSNSKPGYSFEFVGR